MVSNPREREGDIQQQNVLHFLGDDAGLDSSTNGDHFVGVNVLVGFQTDQRSHQFLHHRHAAGTAHQNHLVNIVRSQGWRHPMPA